MLRTAVVFCFLALGALAAAPVRPQPRLVVVVVVDQMRADYLERFEPWFGESGFRRVFRQGVRARDAKLRHAISQTAPGHAVIATGATPAACGIPSNEWLDRTTGQSVYCVAGAEGATPMRLRLDTLGDRIKKSIGGHCKVVSLSLKDRGAVLLGGRHADAAYWLDVNSGRLVTSAYYAAADERAPSRSRAARFVAKLNGTPRTAKRKRRYIDSWRNREWSPLLTVGDPTARGLYGAMPRDDRPGELPPAGMQRNFPHLLADTASYATALATSPFGNEFLLGVAQRAIRSLGLGRGKGTDLLLVSLSALDNVGHAFGPYSHEVADVVLRLDRQLGVLMKRLDATVGRDRWTLALTSDHGVAPIVSFAKQRFGDAEYLDLLRVDEQQPDKEGLAVRLSRHLAASFREKLGADFQALRRIGEGKAQRVAPALFRVVGPQIWFPPALSKRFGIAIDALAHEATEWLRLQGEVAFAISHQELRERRPASEEREDPRTRMTALFANSFDPTRCGDVLVALKPHLHPYPPGAGPAAEHGSPHAHDRHVPWLLVGKGVARGVTLADPVAVADLPATLARIVGIRLIAAATGRARKRALR